MDTYEKKFFDYLTEKEKNFEYAHEIYQQFPKVKEKLIVEFWELLRNKLEIKVSDSEWEANIFEEISERYPKVGLNIASNESRLIRVIFEEDRGRIYYGVWIDARKVNNIPDLERRAEEVTEIKSIIDRNNNYWLGRENFESDFSNIQTLRRMLPKKRDEFAKEFTDTLYKFAEEIKEDVKEMSKMATII